MTTEATETTTAPEQAAPDTPETTTAPESGTASEPADPLERLEKKFDQFLAQQGGAEREAPEPTDLLTALEGGEDEAEFEPEVPVEAEQAFADPAAQEQVEALREFIRAEAEEASRPIQEQLRRQELAKIADEYPDIMSPKVMDRLRPLLTSLAQESGNPEVVDNPTFVRMAYRAVKAELADADATPAEQAADTASVETPSGQSQAGSPSTDEEYKKLVFGNQAPRSVIG